MTGPTHAVIGLATATMYSHLTGVVISAWSIIAIIVGSLLPDIDGSGSITQPGRMFSRILPWNIGRFIDNIVAIPLAFFRVIAKHRELSHWPIIGILLIVGGAWSGYLWLFWLGWGYLFHILADCCTPYGVPLLGPFSSKKFNILSISTGSFQEGIVFIGTLIVLIFFGFFLLPPSIQQGVKNLFRIASGNG